MIKLKFFFEFLFINLVLEPKEKVGFLTFLSSKTFLDISVVLLFLQQNLKVDLNKNFFIN